MTYATLRGLEGYEKRIKCVAPKNIRIRRLVPPQESLTSSGPVINEYLSTILKEILTAKTKQLSSSVFSSPYSTLPLT